jgi:hypothetical protein
MKYWWVNQNQTYKHEVTGGFLWSPKTRSDLVRNQFYENMRYVQPGDVIFSFCDTHIRAIGLATEGASEAPKPEFGTVGEAWSNEGWLVPVEFRELDKPVRPKEYIEQLRPLLPTKYSPLQPTGNGLQNVYLAEVPEPMASALIRIIGPQFAKIIGELQDETEIPGFGDEQERAVDQRTDIGATAKQQLIKARRGQGIFRANVRLIEKSCRITGVSNPNFLRASHIKPWKDSSDIEKLDGNNGLLLAPHIDHLFDKGLIAFTDSGRLLVSQHLESGILGAWGIDTSVETPAFSAQQAGYLEYHRMRVFKQK